MTRAAGPVDPDQLAAAFFIMVDLTHRRSEEVHYSGEQVEAIWEAITGHLKVGPRTTSDLFRRAMALSNLFTDAANRDLFEVDDLLPRREIWCAASMAPVYQSIVDGLAWDTFDTGEFAVFLRPQIEKDVFRAALLLLDQPGRDAGIAASKIADELLEEGEVEGSRAWRRIGAAVEEMTRWPREGESIN
jgi:hypothetical protein